MFLKRETLEALMGFSESDYEDERWYCRFLASMYRWHFMLTEQGWRYIGSFTIIEALYGVMSDVALPGDFDDDVAWKDVEGKRS